jgi:ribosomal protein L13E
MVKHNNVIPNQHFHKDWDKNVKVWNDQAGRKKRRRLARQKKVNRRLGVLLRFAICDMHVVNRVHRMFLIADC